MRAITAKRCPCGCGLTEEQAAQRVSDDLQRLHLAWHRLLKALTDALIHDVKMIIRRWRRFKRWVS